MADRASGRKACADSCGSGRAGALWAGISCCNVATWTDRDALLSRSYRWAARRPQALDATPQPRMRWRELVFVNNPGGESGAVLIGTEIPRAYQIAFEPDREPLPMGPKVDSRTGLESECVLSAHRCLGNELRIAD